MSSTKLLCCVTLLAGCGTLRASAQAAPQRTGISQRVDVQVASDPETAVPASPIPSVAPAESSSSVSPAASSPVTAPNAPAPPPAPAPADAIVVAAQQLPVAKKNSSDRKRILPFSKFAISTKSSTLGAGGQFAVPLMRGLNLRGGVDFFNFGAAATVDGVRYEGQIHLKNGQVNLDWFPFNWQFHISPGVVIFKSALSASMYVAGGNSFDLGNNTFTSNPSDPINGNASIVFSHSIMPSLTIGIGNMITRKGKHWSVPLELGAVYTGHYTVQMNLTGSACIPLGCMSTSSTLVQQSIAAEESGLNEPMKHYQLYPILTSGLSYRF